MATDDLCAVPLTDESLYSTLSSRYRKDLIWTRLGSTGLVSINPYKPLIHTNDEHLATHVEAYRQGGELQAHIYELATRIFFSMRRSGLDQSVVLSGITGSGKTTSNVLLINAVLKLATHSKKETKMANAIRSAHQILASFGSARTAQNASASRFAKWQELQFNERGRIIGAKFLTFGLDKHRVYSVPKEERTFDVFYALLAGTSLEEKNALQINYSPDHFYFLTNASRSRHVDTSDQIAFDNLKTSLKACGFKAKTVVQMFQILAAILHLGNLQFLDTKDNAVSTLDACVVKNKDTLELVAGLLGVSSERLEMTLTYKLTLVSKELCTVFLNSQQAAQQRDAFASALYVVLFQYIVENINTRTCYEQEPPNFVGILDMPGFQTVPQRDCGFEDFCINFASERQMQFVWQGYSSNQTVVGNPTLDEIDTPRREIGGTIGCMELLVGKQRKTDLEDKTPAESLELGGLIGVLDKEARRLQAGATDVSDANLLASYGRQFGAHPSFAKSGHAFSFGINHFAGTAHYNVDGFTEKNQDSLSPDFVNLFREGSCSNEFIQQLFQSESLMVQAHPQDDRTVIKAQLPTRPMRSPSTRRPKRKPPVEHDPMPGFEEKVTSEEGKRKPDEVQNAATVLDQLYVTLRDLFSTMANTQKWNIFHIRPNDTQQPDSIDARRVKAQIKAMLIPDICAQPSPYIASYAYDEFVNRYGVILGSLGIDDQMDQRGQVTALARRMNWTSSQCALGERYVWLSFSEWRGLENEIRARDKQQRGVVQDPDYDIFEKLKSPSINSNEQLLPPNAPFASGRFDDSASYLSEDDYSPSRRGYDEASQFGGESEWGDRGLLAGFGPNTDMSQMYGTSKNEEEAIEEMPISTARVWWVRFVWLMTWWIPSFLLRWIGKIKREDVRMAWREKFTLCILIFFFSAVVIFVIIGLSSVLCPGTKSMYSTGNVASHATSNDFYVSIRGQVYDITRFAKQDHGTSTYPAGPAELAPWAGQDLSYDFPIPLSQGCYGLVSDDSVKVIPNITIALPTFIHYSGPTDQSDPSLTAMRQENWYFNTFSPAISPYKVGYIVIPMSTVQADYSSWGRSWAVIDGSIYDLSDYFATAKTYSGVAGVPNYHYIDSQLEQLFQQYGGEDISSYVAKYKSLVSPTTYAYNMNCLKNMFYVGSVDVRMGVKCQITNYLLLAFAALMCLIILVKFLAALQFGSKSTPEDQDKFVICQVPCYTEGEESLRKTINSLTTLRYDDKRKLLLLICDGMVMGSGNERPTPRIVLDILGADPLKDPEPLMFKSVAEGSRQLNYGKVYSGLYEYEGQCVPYMVIVKVGKASERSKPGNRGKRDSQIILMRFLNRVHFDGDMSPLELEMYHQMKNVIGVNPSFYEYILMVDADTEVMPDALQRLISSMLHDGKVIGICGETTIENEQKSWTTMIQVYEYFISHHLAKAFESIFGSVTCLPGCFCMYRVRTPSKQMPLIISNKVIGDYCDNHVDTLHKKNLLHLGEDRYLTTLMMKHFPQYKMKFNPHAKCKTTAPEKWSVLLSQRRRWINSTVHNLLELVFLPELCGFCCFSMRFVVMIDLVGTFLLPSSVVYIVYLLYVAISGNGPFPLISIVMLASIYGLQAIIFIFKREWQYIGWMIIYILAIPVFSFFLPIYSFWHFDDFSWGNTRVVVGDKKKIIVSADEEKFDERMIPMKKWSTYEQELWEMGSGGSHDSRGTRITARTYQSRLTGSVNGSQVDFGSQYGGTQYDYYRDTNVSQQNEKQRSASSSRSTLLPNYMDNGYSSGDFGVDRLTMYGFNPNRASYALSNRSFGDLDTMSHPGLLRPGSVMSTSQMYQRATSPSLVPLNPTNGDESMPTDAMIVAEIKSILASADLMSITKKQVREQLSTFFGVDLSSKREFINHTIESVLQEPQ